MPLWVLVAVSIPPLRHQPSAGPQDHRKFDSQGKKQKQRFRPFGDEPDPYDEADHYPHNHSGGSRPALESLDPAVH